MSVQIVRTACAVGLLASLFGCQRSLVTRNDVGVLRRDSIAAQHLNEQALGYIEQGKFDEAEQTLRGALQADPFYGPAHSNLGVVLVQRGAFYEGAWQLRSAARLMPRASQPRANLGLLFALVGRYGDAEEELRAALKVAPEDIEIVGHLARIHTRQGLQTDETVAWLEAITLRDDNETWRRWARGVLVNQNEQIPNSRYEGGFP